MLFFLTAVAEIVGCFLPWLRLVDGVRLSIWDWSGALVAFCGMLMRLPCAAQSARW
ncbi:hypothetical protein [Candidatus Pantoea persica]|uniref:hypothetical protein n=1 Tax=Candidatus Pantoea persica TaxID=2518128 RepID=UPI0035A8A0B4